MGHFHFTSFPKFYPHPERNEEQFLDQVTPLLIQPGFASSPRLHAPHGTLRESSLCVQTLPGAETHPDSQRVREQVAWSQPYSCYWLKLIWVPPLRTWAQMLVQRPGRLPLLAQGFARLAESLGNVGTQDQRAEHSTWGLSLPGFLLALR